MAGFLLALMLLAAVDLMIAVASSLHAGSAAVVFVVLFFSAFTLAIWRRWTAALFALHTLAVLALLARGAAITGGEVVPGLLRTAVTLMILNGLVWAVAALRPPDRNDTATADPA